MLVRHLPVVRGADRRASLPPAEIDLRLGCPCHPCRSQTSAPPATAGHQLQILRARANHCLSPTTTKYRKCRNSILILYGHQSDSKDVLEASVMVGYFGR